MARTAVRRRDDMAGMLAAGNRTVVAGRAKTNDLAVINFRRRLPHRLNVAGLARGSRSYVFRCLACRVCAVMANGARRDRRLCMRECARLERRRCVARFAIRTGRYVCSRLIRSIDTVVAGRATRSNAGMIERRRLPSNRR